MLFFRKKIYYCLISLFFLLYLSPGFLQALPEDIVLDIKEDRFSVDIKDASILEILNKLKAKKGIWFRGEPAILGERVSVYFKNLPLERGLHRILASLDYCLHFDAQGKWIGVTLLKKDQKEVQRGTAYRPPYSTGPTPPSPPPSSGGPLYIPKSNPLPQTSSKNNGLRPPPPPLPKRIIKPPVNNPFDPNLNQPQGDPLMRSNNRPLPPPPQFPIPEPPDMDDEEEEEPED